MNDNIKDSELTDAFSTRLMEQKTKPWPNILQIKLFAVYIWGDSENHSNVSER